LPRKYASVRALLRNLYARNAPHKSACYNILYMILLIRNNDGSRAEMCGPFPTWGGFCAFAQIVIARSISDEAIQRFIVMLDCFAALAGGRYFGFRGIAAKITAWKNVGAAFCRPLPPGNGDEKDDGRERGRMSGLFPFFLLRS
jgi:hypothetical protein